jgi:uncharacterized protein (TIGR02594 family)
MINRRQFIGGIAAASGTASLLVMITPATAQRQAPANPPGRIGFDPDYVGPLPPESDSLGKKRPLDAEEKVAASILASSPLGPTPYGVASYFLSVGSGQYGDEWKPYVQGWPVRWNPVIVTFFQATSTEPEGDVTSWCAAFVNWCFLRADHGPATHSASSGSFRSFGTVTGNPSAGDLVVFRRTNVEKAALGQGHVGFFVKDLGDKVQVLGGNQIEGRDGCHMISLKAISKIGTALVLDSYRTDLRLRN